MLKVPPQGSPSSSIYLVGEAPGAEEEIAGVPFVGSSGQELDRQLRDAGIERSDCYVTNVCQFRPPDNKMEKWLKRTKSSKEESGWKYEVHPYIANGRVELLDTIQRYRPKLVIGFGNVPLWALTGEWGVSAWRGSEMLLQGGIHFVPTLHPAAILREWSQRPQVIHDLKYRCARRLREGFEVPQYKFNTNPTLDEVMEFIESLPIGGFAADIETAKGKTLCLGIASSPHNAMCIPFWNSSGKFWGDREEQMIVRAIHDNSAGLIGQNWNYDRQYLANDFQLDFAPYFDTYIAQSVLFPGTERGLGYLSSIYCSHHLYWKEDAKDWGNIKDFGKLFRYNCKDVCKTFESAQVLREKLNQAGLRSQFESRMSYADYVYRMMMRGVTRSPERTIRMLEEIDLAVKERERIIEEIAGEPVNFGSSKQVANLLFKKLGFKPTARTEKGAESTKDEALRKLVEKNPEAEKVCTPILEARSLANVKANFLGAELDPDGKLRSSWMATGTETFRLTSSKNAFHRGGPMQNITDGKHTHSGRPLPNLRSTIIPPEGCLYWNTDLERADVQVVAWEANDSSLKKMLRERADIHLVNAVDLFDLPNVPYDECLEKHPRYQEHKERHEQPRHFAKTFTHLTNYGGQARTAAIKTHTTVARAEKLQKRWFEIHPGIAKWHNWVKACLMANRTIKNKFGYRRVYFDRIDSCFPEALAWIPQSTVSLYISEVQMRMEDAMKDVGDETFGIELQGHDSLAGYMHKDIKHLILPRMKAAADSVVVPYDDPLVIPLELSLSESSWGEVKKVAWSDS